MLEVRLYNTLTRRKETLVPLESGHIKLYACGVTVYDESHLGHAMQATVFDFLVSFLQTIGYRVTYVRNFTDVDDKIIKRAHELNLLPAKLAEEIIASTRGDFVALGLTEPTVEPRVSRHIEEIIQMIATLCAKDYAYATEAGNVYFRVRRFKDYGHLSNRKIEQLQNSETDNDDKEDLLDFALWKSDTTESVTWDSPWGKGRPGWHIECSAMAKKHLGASFDIHGGGRDLIFPHHENEIAQSVCANDESFAAIWMHNGLLTVNGQKMAKSLRNHLSIKAFLHDWSAEILRLHILLHHYRSNIDFSQESFKQARRRLLYYYHTLHMLQQVTTQTSASTQNMSAAVETQHANFTAAMCDDLNTPVALAHLHETCKKANELHKTTQRGKEQANELLQLLTYFGKVLGLFRSPTEKFISEQKLAVLADSGIGQTQLQSLIDERSAARHAKNFTLADKIRKDLQAKGIDLQDYNDRSDWTIMWR